MTQARDEAKRYHHKYIRTEHLLLAMFHQDALYFTDLGIDVACIREEVASMHCPTCDADEQMVLSASAERAWQLAQSYAEGQTVTEQHVILGILQSSLTVRRLFESCGVDVSTLVANLESKIQHDE